MFQTLTNVTRATAGKIVKIPRAVLFVRAILDTNWEAMADFARVTATD